MPAGEKFGLVNTARRNNGDGTRSAPHGLGADERLEVHGLIWRSGEAKSLVQLAPVVRISQKIASGFGSLLLEALKEYGRFGGEYRKLYINFQQYGYADGQYNFDQTWTQFNPAAANGTGSSYASALLGLASSGHTTEEPSAAEASSYTALYIQDTWKVTPKLTLDPGLRWELETPRTERFNRISYWNPNLPSPLQGKVSASATCPNCGDLVGQMLFPGNTGKYGRHQGPTQ